MKLTDKLIQKYGNDKLLHFSIGGWVTALCGLFGQIPLVIGGITITLLNVVKEYLFDNTPDWKDVKATFLGCSITFIIYIIKQLLFN